MDDVNAFIAKQMVYLKTLSNTAFATSTQKLLKKYTCKLDNYRRSDSQRLSNANVIETIQ